MKDAPSKPYNCPVEVSACLVLLKNKKKNYGKKNLKATTKKQLSWLFNIFFTKKRKKNVGVDSGSTDKAIEKIQGDSWPWVVMEK